MKKLIDLHVHTTNSDGEYSPKGVIDIAHNNNVEILSITDHDTINSYTKDIFNYARSKNIKLISGVEISTKINKCGIHVLGYNIDIKNIKLINKLKLLRNSRHDYLFNVSKKLNDLGYILNTEELDKIDSVTKAHIASDIVNNELNKDILLKEFNHIPEKGEFIETLLNENCKAYVKKETITPVEAAKLIRESGGIPVLAHPVAYFYEDNLNEDDILKLVKDMNINYIEANYIYIDKFNNKINDIDKWKNFATKYNLNTTIGSDFHNKDDIHPTIGLLNETINLENINIKEITN